MNRLKWMTRCSGRITLLNRDRGRQNSEILLGSCDSWWCQLSLRFSVELCCCIVWISSLFVVQSYISHLSPKMCFDTNYSVFRKRFFVILQLRICFPSPYMFWFSVPFRFEYDIFIYVRCNHSWFSSFVRIHLLSCVPITLDVNRNYFVLCKPFID